MPLQYERASLAGAAVREKLRSTVATRGRAYDVARHQQAAMPEQLLAPEPVDPERVDQEQRPADRRRSTGCGPCESRARGWKPSIALMLQDVLGEPEWAALLTPADRRGLTALFWSSVRPTAR
ncbi:hypothetical protein [Streptomyces sp. NPDC056160]|uniref:hypothetical protein n=1 Tax=Streptomyces sp. NPDC056160 TaxID=3345731 RepID=UPI0035DC7CC2